ncbi:DMT family transporter [Rubellimicrobium roseum]|uniref:DMT family transporter n=2 Tax=Rubellimicrobium roseum TaxID=687525 RepID=A0A5C4N4W6_9RHOB|nr:DMT family transporter [Rubellimicrobium roseum]
MLGFVATAPLIDVASKLAAETVPVGQVTAARFVVQGLLMLPLMLPYGLRLPPALLPLVALRGLMLVLSTYAFVSAIEVMPLADALAIVFVMPFILLILGRLVFGDAVGPRRIVACLVGFGGSLLVIQPSLATFGLVALWPLGTAASFAVYMLVTRGLSPRMLPVPMQFHTSALAVVLCLPVLLWAEGSGHAELDPVWPRDLAWLWLFGVGLASAVAHMLMTVALRFAPSATLAPLNYLEIVTASALGYLIFGDFPDALTWAGIAVIVGSGLYIIHRERQASAERRAALPAPAEASHVAG